MTRRGSGNGGGPFLESPPSTAGPPKCNGIWWPNGCSDFREGGEVIVDNTELELIRASMRNLLEGSKPADVPKDLIDLGWVEILEAEPAVAVGFLAEEQGRILATSPALDLAMLHGAGLPIDATTAWVLPPMARSFVFPGTTRVDQLHIEGLAVAGSERAERFVVATAHGIVVAPANSVMLTPVSGFDPNLGLQRAQGTAKLALTSQVADAPSWTRALAQGRRSLAAEMIG